MTLFPFLCALFFLLFLSSSWLHFCLGPWKCWKLKADLKNKTILNAKRGGRKVFSSFSLSLSFADVLMRRIFVASTNTPRNTFRRRGGKMSNSSHEKNSSRDEGRKWNKKRVMMEAEEIKKTIIKIKLKVKNDASSLARLEALHQSKQ